MDGGLELLRHADLIVVPGWRDLDQAPAPEITDALRAAVKARRARGVDLLGRVSARRMPACSTAGARPRIGVMPSAWRNSFPSIKVEPDVLYVDEGNVMTSAGSAAGIDLLLHIVRKDYGARVANLFARRLVVPAHRDGGQSQFVVQPIAVRTNDRISSVADWMASNLEQSVSRSRRWPIAPR